MKYKNIGQNVKIVYGNGKFKLALSAGHSIKNTPGKQTMGYKIVNGKAVADSKGTVTKEWVFNDKIRDYVIEYLTSNYTDFTIINVDDSDDGDKDIPLWQRVDYAVKTFKADLYFSIHNNAGGGTGYEMWIENKDLDKKIAQLCIEEIQKDTTLKSIKNRGIKYSKEFTELIRPSIPSIITESLFMDNINDLNLLLNDNVLKAFGYAYAKAIVRYANLPKIKVPTTSTTSVKTQTTTTKATYRVRKSWSDAKSQIGAYSVLQNAKDLVNKNPSYKVFDDKGNVVYEVKSTTTYRVRKSWSDAKSQIGAFSVLQNAKDLVNKNAGKGYKVFDEQGNAVYSK